MRVLVVVDMQNDFIDGVLGTKEAASIVSRIEDKIRQFQGRVLFTRDTHGADYAETLEGKKLPAAHCIRGSHGWEIHPQLAEYVTEEPIDKPSFGSVVLGEKLAAWHAEEPIEEIILAGVCTDVCVISNAILCKAFLPEVPVTVDASCCAGVTPQTHKQALEAMKVCQIDVLDPTPAGK